VKGLNKDMADDEDNGWVFYFFLVELFILYLSEIISFYFRTKVMLHDDSYEEEPRYEAAQTAQLSINGTLLFLQWCFGWIFYRTKVLKFKSIGAHNTITITIIIVMFIIMMTLGLINTFTDTRIHILKKLLIDFFGYTIIIGSWILVGNFIRGVKGGVWVLFLLHCTFQLEIIVGNILHEAETTINSVSYLISVVENILLFEILHLAIEALYSQYVQTTHHPLAQDE